MNIIHDEDFEEALNNLSRDFGSFKNNEKKCNIFMGDEINQRERERQIRETLQSRHGPTAEVHDQVSLNFECTLCNL